MEVGDYIRLSTWERFYKVVVIEDHRIAVLGTDGRLAYYPKAVFEVDTERKDWGRVMPWIVKQRGRVIEPDKTWLNLL